MQNLIPFNIKLLLLIVLLISSESSFAIKLGSWDNGKVITLPNFTGGTGDTTSYNEFCVSPAAPYQIKIRNSTGAAGGAFSLLSGALPPLPVTFQFQDLLNPGYETLSPDVYTALNKTGSKCTGGPGGADNAAILITILNSDLANADPGLYTRTFVVTARDGAANVRSANLTLNLTIPSLMQISGLNDIIFPAFDGINPLIASESFCIYRNGAGLYSVTAQGSGPALAFSLTDGISPLPYSLTWNDTGTTVAVTANTALANRANAFTANTTCNGGANNNATVGLSISVANINAVPRATYVGTLTLIITPQ